MKKFLIFIGIIGVVGGVFVGYVYVTTKATIYNELSPRAKQYLKLRRDANDRSWQAAGIDNPENAENRATVKTVTAEKCFQITIPIPASEVRREADCQYRVFLTQPAGMGVVYMKLNNSNTLEDVGDVSMRLLYPDQYKQEKVRVGERTFYVFQKNGDLYEKIAFYLENHRLYVFSLIIPTNENLDSKFASMLQSVKIYNE